MDIFAVFETWYLGDGNYAPLKKGQLVNLSFEIAQLIADKPTPSGPTPRASDGKHDLGGVCENAVAKPLGEGPQPLPWAEAAGKQRGKRGRLTDLGPGACMPGDISLAVFDEYRIIQTPTLIVILDGGFNPDRQIYFDGRGHQKDFNPSWMGHSIGHWKGDTLMVDTVGFNDLGWIRVLGSFPQTEKLRINERFRRLDLEISRWKGSTTILACSSSRSKPGRSIRCRRRTWMSWSASATRTRRTSRTHRSKAL